MKTRGSCPGFTLIELLVVIAIIAILAAILAPIYLAASQRSVSARCQAHEKELMAALMMYTDDYQGRMPGITFVAPSICQPYIKNHGILMCQHKSCYGYNWCLCGPLGVKAWIGGELSSRSDVKKNADFTGRPFSSVVYPSRTMAFICGGNKEAPEGWGWEPHDIGDDYIVRMGNRHAGGTNYAFLDTHVKWLRPTGRGFPIATDGLDYDGNGTTGTTDFMR